MSISSGVSSVYPAGGIQSTLWQLSSSQQQLLSSSAATPAAPPENVSEQFFDARLKLVFLFILHRLLDYSKGYTPNYSDLEFYCGSSKSIDFGNLLFPVVSEKFFG